MSIWIVLVVAAAILYVIARANANGSSSGSNGAGEKPARNGNGNDITVNVEATPARLSAASVARQLASPSASPPSTSAAQAPATPARTPAKRNKKMWMSGGKEEVNKKRKERGHTTIFTPSKSLSPKYLPLKSSPKSKSAQQSAPRRVGLKTPAPTLDWESPLGVKARSRGASI